MMAKNGRWYTCALVAVVLVAGSSASGTIQVRRGDSDHGYDPGDLVTPSSSEVQIDQVARTVNIYRPYNPTMSPRYHIWEDSLGDIESITANLYSDDYYGCSLEVVIAEPGHINDALYPGAHNVKFVTLHSFGIGRSRLLGSYLTGSVLGGVTVKANAAGEYGTMELSVAGDAKGYWTAYHMNGLGLRIGGDFIGNSTLSIKKTTGTTPEPVQLVQIGGSVEASVKINVHGEITMHPDHETAIVIGDGVGNDEFQGTLRFYEGLNKDVEIWALNSGTIEMAPDGGALHDITGEIRMYGPTDDTCNITAANLDDGAITQASGDQDTNDFRGDINLSGDLLNDAQIQLPGLIYGAKIMVGGDFDSGTINISRDPLDGLIDVTGAWSGKLVCFDGIDTGTVTAASLTSTGVIACQDVLSIQPVMDGTIEIAGEMAGEIDLAYGVGDDAEVTLGSVGETGLIWMENWLNTTDLYDMEGSLLVEGDFKGELKLDRISGTVEIEQSLWADPTFPDTTYGSIRFSNLQGDVLINTTCQTLGSYPTNYPWQGKIYHDGVELDRNYYASDPDIGDDTTGGSITPHMIDLPCRGDLNGDDAINQQDLGILLAHFEIAGDCRGDLNQDGETDQSDLGILLAVFDTTCN